MSALPNNPPATAAFDTDAQETREWLEALDAVISAEGPERAHFLLEKLIEEARHNGIDRPFSATTPYINTIEPVDEERSPGNLEIEGRLQARIDRMMKGRSRSERARIRKQFTAMTKESELAGAVN